MTIMLQDVRRYGEETPPQQSRAEATFSLGFRPFFLGAMGMSALLVLMWGLLLFGTVQLSLSYYGPVVWHGHEMLFGVVAAVIAGFLLTASSNWTGLRTINGKPLAALVLLWLCGRLLPLLNGVHPTLVAVVDLAFLPCLTVAVASPIIRAGNKRNLVFIPMLAMMALANALVHMQSHAMGYHAALGLRLGTAMVVLMMALIGGRIIPFFTSRGLGTPQAQSLKPLELSTVAATLLALLLFVLQPRLPAIVSTVVYAAAAMLHVVRLARWFHPKIWSKPIVWVLHIGYLWIGIGFALLAIQHVTASIAPSIALHAWTTGAMATLIIGMVSRVSLGHTGRPLAVAQPVVAAYVLITMTAAARVLGPLVGVSSRLYLGASALTWLTAFLLMLWVYVPILTQPRADGKLV